MTGHIEAQKYKGLHNIKGRIYTYGDSGGCFKCSNLRTIAGQLKCLGPRPYCKLQLPLCHGNVIYVSGADVVKMSSV